MALINIYQGAVTAGGTNGTQVSTSGSYSTPIVFELDASQNESKVVALAIRTDSGYTTTGTVTIADYGDTNDRLKLSWTQNGTFTDSITTTNAITDVNTLFYCKASSDSSESPTSDRSASLHVTAKIIVA